MNNDSKRPSEDALVDGSHGSPAPLGALSPLPEVLLAHLCSFLSGRDLARLGGACAALHESPVSLWLRLKVGLRKDWCGTTGENEEGWQRQGNALRMLARRAASGLKELRVDYGKVLEAFCSAVREGGQPLRQLASLHLEFLEVLQREARATVETGARALAEVLAAGQLPALEELHLSAFGVRSMLPVWRAVGEGACPRLQKIAIDFCGLQQITELAEAMRARPDGCEELRAVCLKMSSIESEEQAAYETLQALLSRLSSRSLEELSLKNLPPESLQAAIIPAFSSSWATLKTLTLSFDLDDEDSADGLLHALSRGAMPSLTCLEVTGAACSDEAWRALGEAMGPEGTCLRRVRTLKLYEVISSPRQVAILCRALGTGHGCPELESLNIISGPDHAWEPWGAALAPAFRPPHGLPRLKELCLEYMNLKDLDQLVEALQHRPHASQPMEAIKLLGFEVDSAAALGQAMAQGGSLACLKQLTMSSGEGGVEWRMQLAEALAGGAGQQLVECSVHHLLVDVVNRLLQGLAVRGACPRLQSLWLEKDPDGLAEERQLDACSLGTILAGRAACSATLRELRLDNFSLSNEGVRRLAACLREPQAIQLESLELRAGEPDACEAVMELLSALGGRAGGRLRNLVMRLPKCEDGEAMRAVEHAVGIIKAGGVPALGSEARCIKVVAAKSITVCDDAVRRALWERAQEQWLASW